MSSLCLIGQQKTAAEVVNRRILPGSIIFSDQWAAYASVMTMLQRNRYQHFSVCHSRHFIDPITSTHTQNIEALWSYLKRNLRTFGTNRGTQITICNKIHAIMFRKLHANNTFTAIIQAFFHSFRFTI